MALQYGGTLAGNQLTAVQTSVGAGGLLRIYSTTAAAHPGSTEPTGLLCTITLPTTFITVTAGTTSAAAFTTIASGPWSNTASGGGAGTNAVSFRIYDSAATTCHVSGLVSATGGGGELQLNNVSIATGQTVSVTAFTITAANF